MASSCQYEGCKVPVEPNSEFCIFHAPSPKDLEKFRRALTSQINQQGPAKDRNERYSFDGYVFPASITTEAWPEGEWIQLPQTFQGDASFSCATIEGHVWFDDAKFEGNAEFSYATIEGDAWFDGAEFEGEASFVFAKFEGEASFVLAMIKGYAWLNSATIGGSACFDGAKFERGGRFDDTTIDGDARFNDATIPENSDFDRLICRSLWHGENKPRIRGWGGRRCGVFIAEPESAVSYWRFAQRIFRGTGEREKADAAFYFERLNRWRVLRRTMADESEIRVRRLWANWVVRPGYWSLFLLDLLFVRWTTAYGASLARLFFTWLTVVAGFGVTFSAVPRLIGRAGEPVWTLQNWIVGIHYSVTTFATLGLGQVGPGSSQLGMVLTSIEAILGAVLIALAVLVIGRRFMRQG